MRVRIDDGEEPVGVVDGILTHDTERAMEIVGQNARGTISLANNWATTIGAFVIWLLIVVMNVATLVLLGLGLGGND
jgi:metal iron transporter